MLLSALPTSHNSDLSTASASYIDPLDNISTADDWRPRVLLRVYGPCPYGPTTQIMGRRTGTEAGLISIYSTDSQRNTELPRYFIIAYGAITPMRSHHDAMFVCRHLESGSEEIMGAC